MSKIKRFAAMTAALLICAGNMGYMPESTKSIGGFTANAAEVAAESVEINETNFPDAIFRKYVTNNFDKDGDGVLSAEEIAKATYISVINSGISDLTGIDNLINLKILDCNNNNLKNLDISNNTALTTLFCEYTELTSLNISNNTSLKKLYCSHSNLETLDVSNNTELVDLYCDCNQLKTLDVSNNTKLEYLSCEKNQLTSLDVSNNTALKYFDCDTNQLTTLDVSNNAALEYFDCNTNFLTSIDLSNNPLLSSPNGCIFNKYKIALTNNTFDLSTLPTGFDVSKASDWTNATVKGNILTVEDITKEITYKYDCGKKQTLTFTLIPQIEETPVETTTATTTATTTTTTAAPETTTTATTTVTTTTTFAPPSYSYSLSVYPYDEADTIYEIGEELDYSTICVHGYGGGEDFHADIPYISLANCSSFVTVDASEFDNTKPGTYTIYVKWYDAVDSFEVTVVESDNATAITSVEINEANFPDDVFRQYVAEKFDENNDWTLSYDEVMNVTNISLDESNLYDLTGIQYFKNLSSLWCYDNNLTTLDVSENTALKILVCDYNELTSLDVSNNTALTELYLNDNKLTSLDVSNNTALEWLYFDNNQLTSIDLSNNTALEHLQCSSNQLTSLDVSNNTALEQLYCTNNQLTSINVSNNIELKDLRCNDNQLEIIDVSSCPALTRFECNSNQLTSLDLSSNPKLTYLVCYHNQLTSLDVSGTSDLKLLSCYLNKLTSLDLSSNSALKFLDFGNNLLTSLDISICTALTELRCYSNQLTTLDLSKNTALTKLSCSGNNFTSLDLSKNTALTEILGGYNDYEITVTDSKFDLSTLPNGFDVTKTSDWTNGTVEGTILTIKDVTKEVTYTYNCGNGESETFTLIPTKSAETPEKPPVSLGDINADGLINSSDATLILSNYSAIATGGDSAFSAEQTKAADINNDGKCDSIDASLILAYYAHTSTGGTGTIEEYLANANAEEQLKALREKKESEIQLFAAAYIGCTDDMNEVDAIAWIKENSPVFCENYSFVKNIPSAQIAGTPMGELYCIVPFDENSTVAINRIVRDENGNGSYENVIYRSESGEPVLLFCNNSGVDGDTMVTITDSDGNKDVWFPGLDEKLMM
ncbi:MAG: leucine-rich repeat domain-containing protein, partial [Clostridia bacterium]|nr:leucine-rich repeat domain-containing protein [Clostridia bacterium]